MANIKSILALSVIAATSLTSTAAMAFEATADVALNLRTGPGTDFSILDTLDQNELVNVFECTDGGWCYVNQDGPDGWVSASYLTQVAPPAPPAPPAPAPNPNPQPNDPNCRFEVTLGGGQPQFNLVCDNGNPPANNPPAPPANPGPAPNTACFYTGQNYNGAEFCNGIGTLQTLNAQYNDRISSVKINGNIEVKLCNNAFLGGTCTTLNASKANLGAANNKASSIKISTPAPAVPAVRSNGPINLPQTFSLNLDNGNVGANGADIWFQAVNAAQKYITPRNGAQLALGDGSQRNYTQCAAETFSSNKILLATLPVGSFICVKTNKGRISRIKLTGYQGLTMKLNHRTWEL